MESFGECKGCQRNIKFAVKQARLCRTCYNKTYLTSQKRREYYKNKKRRRELNNASTSVEPAINVHQHRSSSHSSARSIKKTSTSSGHATEQQQQQDYHQPSIQAHHHSGPSCADWVPRQADGFSLLAALAHAASSPSSSPAVRPYFSASSSSSSSSSSLPSSPPSSPPAAAALSLASTTSSASSSTLLPYQQLQLQYQMHQLHVAQAASRSPPSSASPLTASPYGSPLQAGSGLLHDLLQQASAGYPQSYYAAALMAAASSTTTTATVAPPAYSATPKPVTALPSLASVLGGCAPTSSPVAIPTARHAYSPSSTSSEAVTSTAPKSMAIRNLLN